MVLEMMLNHLCPYIQGMPLALEGRRIDCGKSLMHFALSIDTTVIIGNNISIRTAIF